jgi:hypothetical protein
MARQNTARQAQGHGGRDGLVRFGAGVAGIAGRRLTPEPERALPRDPVAWVRDTLDEHLWSAQAAILRALVEHRKVAVQSCHQIGKSYIAARAGAWWIAAHPLGEAQIVTTAPSGDQVRSILWQELQRAHRRGSLPGTITRGQVPEWHISGEQVGQGRKPQDYVSAEQAATQFQGLHARYLLGVLDEGCGIPAWLWGAMDSLATNESSRLLAIGNPTDPTAEFAKRCAPGSGWHVLKISAFDSPNFTGEPVPEQLRESLISPLWVEEVAQTYGDDSAYYIARVLGEFPEVADDVIISPRLIREAHERDLSGQIMRSLRRHGMDVARFGKDESCIYENRGGFIRLVQAWRGVDTTVSTAKAEQVLRADVEARMTIDEVGLGAAVLDPLRKAGQRVTGFSGGERAVNEQRFVNRNSESWWGFREAMAAGLIDLDPEDEVLAAQLGSRKWKLDASQRRIAIESKEEMSRRGIASPDRADGAVMSWYEGYRVPDPETVLPLNPDRSMQHDELIGDIADRDF